MADSDQVEMQPMLSRWQGLKSQAESGDLRLDPDIGQKLAAHAERMRGQLDELIQASSQLEHLSGFGTLGSAEALRGKFSAKANGADDSAVARLKQSSDVLALMKETYDLAVRKLGESDQSSAGQIDNLGTGD